ncbi:MAG TPA: hypothetical protein VGR62_20415 [Candidatus Binatia bacterium]|jgi:hypothetical protein|nr:hypothetical protein [Candidatus Binatia bacterium]
MSLSSPAVLIKATRLLGIVFTFLGIGWLLNPSQAAAGLGMPLLDGIARSTQIGDLSTFFLTAGATMLAGSRPGNARLLYVPAGLIGGAAITRTLAWALHGAAFAGTFIAVELVTGLVLVTAARTLDAPSHR